MAPLHCIWETKDSSNLASQFDGAGVEAGEGFFKSQTQEQDYKDLDIQQLGGDPTQDHEHTGVKQSGTKEEPMEANQMLDTNQQFKIEDGEEFINLNQTFNSTTQFTNKAGPDKAMGSQMLDCANEFTNEAARREASSMNQDYVNEQMHPFVSKLESKPVEVRNAIQINEQHQQPNGTGNGYHFVQNSFYIPGPQNTGLGAGRANPATIYGHHIADTINPYLYQRESGSKHGSPAQHPMHMVGQTSFSPVSTALYSAQDPRTISPRQHQQPASFPHRRNISGHAHLANIPIERPMFPQKNDGSQVINLCDDSSDAEPLQTRTRRHTASVSTAHQSSQISKSHTGTRDIDYDVSDSEVKVEGVKFNFKLPSHEAIYEESPDGYHFAKISLPGLVREAIVLSPDHSEEEYHLFLNVFLPSHLSLPTPDPEPALGVLNFHTIAGLVIETYHLIHNEEGKEIMDIDPDEVFFQVVDKWRVGMMSGREGYKVVRGIQEFCDVALDLIFWIKEHGFGVPNPEPEKKRKERADKGTKRGPRAGDTIGKGLDTKKIARPSAKVNTLHARKKTVLKANDVPKKKLSRPAGKIKEKEEKKKKDKETLGKVTVIKSQAGQKK